MRQLILFVVLALATTAYGAAISREPVVGVCTTESGEKVKCTRFRPRVTPDPLPSPDPTRSPSPTATPKPLPCETLGTKTYQVGEEKMLCFDVVAAESPLVEVSVQNHGNLSCGELEAELRGPTGLRNYSLGPQPNTVLPRTPGRYYLWTRLTWGCNLFTFRAR